MSEQERMLCWRCKGRGSISPIPCGACAGTGRIAIGDKVHPPPPIPDLQQLTTIVDRLIRAHHDGSPEWDYLEDQYQQLKGK